MLDELNARLNSWNAQLNNYTELKSQVETIKVSLEKAIFDIEDAARNFSSAYNIEDMSAEKDTILDVEKDLTSKKTEIDSLLMSLDDDINTATREIASIRDAIQREIIRQAEEAARQAEEAARQAAVQISKLQSYRG